MADRYFHLRLRCTYKGDKNDINELAVEVHNNNEWEALDLNITSPGFLLFICGLLSCQHLYMRTNCAERNLIIKSATGDLQIVAGEDWSIKDASIAFTVKLKSGLPKDDDIHYIMERMKHCPVSTNMTDAIYVKNSIHFDQ